MLCREAIQGTTLPEAAGDRPILLNISAAVIQGLDSKQKVWYNDSPNRTNVPERINPMGLTTILKEEVGDILVAVRQSADAAALAGDPRDSLAFLQGYHAAVDSVAIALGLRLPPAHSLRAVDRTRPDRGHLPRPGQSSRADWVD